MLTRWPMWRRWFGTRAERAAAKFLKKLGYRIVGRNIVLAPGELDIVALDGECIVFVEVRSTERGDIERPTASVDHEKQRRLSNLAVAFLQKHHLLGHTARFDIIAVSWPANCREPTIVHHKSAFESVGRFQMFS